MENPNNETQDQRTTFQKSQTIETGYGQHASPNNLVFPEYHNATNPKIQNVLIQRKNDNKSDYTINFTRKALSALSHHTSTRYVCQRLTRCP